MPRQHTASHWDKMLWPMSDLTTIILPPLQMILRMLPKNNELGQSLHSPKIAAKTFVSNIAFANGWNTMAAFAPSRSAIPNRQRDLPGQQCLWCWPVHESNKHS